MMKCFCGCPISMILICVLTSVTCAANERPEALSRDTVHAFVQKSDPGRFLTEFAAQIELPTVIDLGRLASPHRPDNTGRPKIGPFRQKAGSVEATLNALRDADDRISWEIASGVLILRFRETKTTEAPALLSRAVEVFRVNQRFPAAATDLGELVRDRMKEGERVKLEYSDKPGARLDYPGQRTFFDERIRPSHRVNIEVDRGTVSDVVLAFAATSQNQIWVIAEFMKHPEGPDNMVTFVSQSTFRPGLTKLSLDEVFGLLLSPPDKRVAYVSEHARSQDAMREISRRYSVDPDGVRDALLKQKVLERLIRSPRHDDQVMFFAWFVKELGDSVLMKHMTKVAVALPTDEEESADLRETLVYAFPNADDPRYPWMASVWQKLAKEDPSKDIRELATEMLQMAKKQDQ